MGNSDSRAVFRGLVQALLEDDIAPESPLWEKFWDLPKCADDVFELIQPGDVRMLLRENPAKLQTLLLKAARKMEGPLVASGPLDAATALHALNAVRVLTRVLPFVLERQDEAFVDAMLWDPASFDGTSSVAETLIWRLGRLLFLPGFTLSPRVARPAPREAGQSGRKVMRPMSTSGMTEDNDTDTGEREDGEGEGEDSNEEAASQLVLNTAILWSEGVGTASATAKPIVDDSLNMTRYELLKLLLVFQSGVLYSAPSGCKPETNRWIAAISLHELETGGICFGRELFFSLLNQVCRYDPVGWGVPFASAIRSGKSDDLFTDACLQNLLVLLEVNSWSNVFRRLLSDIQAPEELELLYSSIARLLRNVPEATNALLPGSTKPVECYQELLVLFWKLLDSNKAFMTYALQSCDIQFVVAPVCFFMWNGRKDPAKVGLLHMCTFVLLLLSGERNFGVNLNDAFDLGRLALNGAPKVSQGNLADVLVVVFHKLIVDGTKRLSTLYNCFLTVLSNISPYIKGFSQASSMRLLQLFEHFSGRRFLLGGENNHQYITFLLDVFNNVIQYQYEGNAQLVYALCLKQETLRRLATLELVQEAGGATPREGRPGSAQRKNGTATEYSDPGEPINGPAEGTALQLQQAARQQQALHGAFVPTQDWFSSWKSKLPLSALLRMLDILVPKVEAMCRREDGTTPRDGEILHFLRNSTMVGLLPVPHPIVIRRYQPNQYTTLWFTTYTWSVIYLRNQDKPLWDGKLIRLFTINLVSK